VSGPRLDHSPVDDHPLVGSIAGVPADAFDGLDASAGAAGCYHRLRQREMDGRWQVGYALHGPADAPTAVLPGYIRRGVDWPDPAYDVNAWTRPLDPAAPSGSTSGPHDGSQRELHRGSAALAADQCVFVGGCADLRSALHLGPAGRTETGARRLLAAFARANPGRSLVFPYLYRPDRDLVDHATGGRCWWAVLGRESYFPHLTEPNREALLGSRVRGVLRHDRRLIASVGLRAAVTDWADAPADTAELIAAHNTRKGSPDHPEFVALRHDQWADCPSVRVVVFSVRSGPVHGVLSALVWRDQLELYEVGLAGPDGPARLAGYLDLLFHQPIRFAAAHGLTAVRAGLAAEVPKKSRGARLREVYGGVLWPADAARLADVAD
jgi:hypothetical protein